MICANFLCTCQQDINNNPIKQLKSIEWHSSTLWKIGHDVCVKMQLVSDRLTRKTKEETSVIVKPSISLIALLQ